MKKKQRFNMNQSHIQLQEDKNQDVLFKKSFVDALYEEPPAYLHNRIMQAVEKEITLNGKGRMEAMKRWSKRVRIISTTAAVIMLLIIGGVIGSLMNSSQDYYYSKSEAAEPMEMAQYNDEAIEMEMDEGSFGGLGDGVELTEEEVLSDIMDTTGEPKANQTARKIIRTQNMYVETLEFDTFLAQVEELLVTTNGYIEQSSVSGRPINNGEYTRRHANYTLRVPKEHFQSFVNDIQTIGNVVSESSGGEDITYNYLDTEARLKSLQTQEERLLAILEKADKLEDVILLESELSQVRYQIESMTGMLKRWDNLVDYATVYLEVEEVREIKEVKPEPKTWGERIAETFKQSVKGAAKGIQNFVIFIVGAIPYLVIISIVVAIVVLPIKAIRNKKKKRKEREMKIDE